MTVITGKSKGEYSRVFYIRVRGERYTQGVCRGERLAEY